MEINADSSGGSPGTPEILTVDTTGAAKLLNISIAHLHVLKNSGRLGPTAIRLGRCRRYRTAELKDWVNAGCPDRARWRTMRGKDH
jgi:hypothetical protein